MINKNITLDIVIPVFNESKVLGKLFKELGIVFSDKKLKINKTKKVNLIFVDDGSTDETVLLIKKYASRISKVISIKIVKFTRNFGHVSAVWAGLKESKGDVCVVMDCDLQDPPKVIWLFLKKWRQGFLIVNGIRLKRNEHFVKKLLFYSFYKIFSFFSDAKVEQSSGDFSLVDKKVLKKINSLEEKNKIFRFSRMWTGYNSISVEYERNVRAEGDSKYFIKDYFNLASNIIISSSLKMFKIAQYFLFLFIFCVGFLIIYSLNRYYHYNSKSLTQLDFSDETRLWFLVVILVICFVSFCQTLILAVLSGYFKRTFIEVQNRPQYVKDEIIIVK